MTNGPREHAPRMGGLMPGPGRKPAALRALEGGGGHHRPNVPDLEAPKVALARPDGLPADVAEQWDLHAGWIRALGLETVVDSQSVEAMARLVVQARAAEKALESGITETITTQYGQVRRVKPEFRAALDARRAYSLLAQQFGMTPAARAKFAVKPSSSPSRAKDVPGLKNASTKPRGA